MTTNNVPCSKGFIQKQNRWNNRHRRMKPYSLETTDTSNRLQLSTFVVNVEQNISNKPEHVSRDSSVNSVQEGKLLYERFKEK